MDGVSSLNQKMEVQMDGLSSPNPKEVLSDGRKPCAAGVLTTRKGAWGRGCLNPTEPVARLGVDGGLRTNGRALLSPPHFRAAVAAPAWQRGMRVEGHGSVAVDQGRPARGGGEAQAARAPQPQAAGCRLQPHVQPRAGWLHTRQLSPEPAVAPRQWSNAGRPAAASQTQAEQPPACRRLSGPTHPSSRAGQSWWASRAG